MSHGKVAVLLLLVALNYLLAPTEAHIKEKVTEVFNKAVKGIKGLFRHGHKADEHCGQSAEILDNTIEGKPTTDFPKIDIRVGEDANAESTSVPSIFTRRLIDTGKNDGCPDGERLGVGNRCRKSI